MDTQYHVTKDVPAGISMGVGFDDYTSAKAAFDAAATGTHPNGTVVILWDDDENEIERVTITEDTKAAARAAHSASLAEIVAKANARFAK